MIEIDSQLLKMYESLEKLDSLDKHYYLKKDYNVKTNRVILKANMINSSKFDIFNITSKNIHEYLTRDIPTISLYDYLMDRVGLLDFVVAYRYRDSYRKKTNRLKKRLINILQSDHVFFITFTFSDEFIEDKESTLRKYVQRWLKKYSINYVGNIDFGGKNGRLHFHAVISSDLLKIDYKTWRYGAINFQRINNKNSKTLALYINKLCSHSLKESTKNQYLLYPKNNH